MLSFYFARDGKPITPEEWSRLAADLDYVRVAQSYVWSRREPSRRWFVSTIWRGLDGTACLEGRAPVIFETGVFDPAGAFDEWARYQTVAVAVLGHQMTVNEVACVFAEPDRVIGCATDGCEITGEPICPVHANLWDTPEMELPRPRASFTCPRCGVTSHSAEDARHGYCGACHDWTGRRSGAR